MSRLDPKENEKGKKTLVHVRLLLPSHKSLGSASTGSRQGKRLMPLTGGQLQSPPCHPGDANSM